MVDLKILRRAILVGVLLELGLVAMGHYRPAFRPTFELFGCMLIAGVAGLLYARDLARGYGAGALGGVVVGAVCGLVAVATANGVFLPLPMGSNAKNLQTPQDGSSAPAPTTGATVYQDDSVQVTAAPQSNGAVMFQAAAAPCTDPAECSTHIN